MQKAKTSEKLHHPVPHGKSRRLVQRSLKTVDRKDGGKELRRSFTRDVFPIAGDRKLRSVHPEHIEKMLRGVVGRGSHRASVTLFADLKQMFRWAARKRSWKHLIETPPKNLTSRKTRYCPANMRAQNATAH